MYHAPRFATDGVIRPIGPGSFNGHANARPTGLGYFNGQLPFGPSQDFGGASSSFGPQDLPLPDRPTSNCVEFITSLGYGRDLGASGVGACNVSRPSVL